MTVSAEDRKSAIKRVLIRLAELCGDERGITFGETTLAEVSPLRTTIDELRERGLAKLIVMLSNPEGIVKLPISKRHPEVQVSPQTGACATYCW